MLTLVLALACNAETGFSSTNDDPVAPVGDAAALISPGELAFIDAQTGVLYAQEVSITSTGSDDLIIYTAQIVDDTTASFEIANGAGQEAVTVEPGDSTSFLVHLILSEPVSAYASLALQTNDAELLTARIPLSASPAPPDTGMAGDTGDTGL